jgi:hypothetical protein
MLGTGGCLERSGIRELIFNCVEDEARTDARSPYKRRPSTEAQPKYHRKDFHQNDERRRVLRAIYLVSRDEWKGVVTHEITHSTVCALQPKSVGLLRFRLTDVVSIAAKMSVLSDK